MSYLAPTYKQGQTCFVSLIWDVGQRMTTIEAYKNGKVVVEDNNIAIPLSISGHVTINFINEEGKTWFVSLSPSNLERLLKDYCK